MSNPTIEIDIATVDIMGREFKIKCPPDKTTELQKAADYLNSKMQEIQRGDRSVGIDRIAIAAALNIAHELTIEKQNAKSHTGDKTKSNKQLLDLKNKINQALVSTD